MPRPILIKKPEPIAEPVPAFEQDERFLPSGSVLLDCVLGGGWRRGRMVNIVGDKSSGKTLLAIEACANFIAQGGSVDNVRYVEVEAAFDQSYAETLGMPEGLEPCVDVRTVEDLEADLVDFLKDRKDGEGCMYVVDSLDALSDDTELAAKRDEASYGTGKAKAFSQLFRKHIRTIEDKGCLLFVISQIRDNIGARFGEKKKRSGGHALDFYAAQIVWLAEIKKLKRTVRGADRIVGIEVHARTKKNKVAPPFRDCEFTLMFNYGMDDEITMLNWLKEHKALDLIPRSEAEVKATLASARSNSDRELVTQLHTELADATRARWEEIEEALRPVMRKYE